MLRRTLSALPLILIVLLWGVVSPGGASPAAAADGQLQVPRGQGAEAALPSADTDRATATFTVPADTGGSIYLSVDERWNTARNDAYRAKVRITPTGAATLYLVRVDRGAETTVAHTGLPGSVAAGSRLTVEVGATGIGRVQLAARAWSGATAPTSDQLTAVDPATSGLAASSARRVFAYLSSGAAAGRTTVSWAEPATGTTPPSTTAPASSSVGALPAAARTDVVPSNAIQVSPAGSDSAAGTAAAPLRTIAAAIAKAPTGGTVVVRGGVYHEGNLTIDRRITLLAHPGEEVWLDGSSVVTRWQASGARWTTSHPYRFDSSPSFTRGAADGSAASWRFIDPAHPMAAHPDQVFIDGVAQREVSSRSQVVAGTFYIDDGAQQLVLGSDPTGRQVRVSDLQKSISVRAENAQLRGIGIRRYATSLWMMGSVTLERPGIVATDVTVAQNAGIGLGVYADRVSLARITARDNGLMGINANASYGLVADRLLVTGNNAEHFNQSPAAGGFKITRSRDVTVTDSRFEANDGIGLWLDESVYDATITGNDILSNEGHGLSFEISSTAFIADNLISGNEGFGMKINNADRVEIWNNTVTGNSRPINLVQDSRRGTQTGTPGHDPRRPNPDPTMPWLLQSISVKNNVIGDPKPSANCLICVEDYSRQVAASAMRLSFAGNLYNRTGATPTWLAVWSTGRGNPSVYTSMAAFTAATGQEKGSALVETGTVVSLLGALTSSATDRVVPAAWPGALQTLLGGGVRIGAQR